MPEIRKITNSEATNIIETRQPLGLFYIAEEDINSEITYVGIDNRTGDAWTEEFELLSECKEWLKGNIEL